MREKERRVTLDTFSLSLFVFPFRAKERRCCKLVCVALNAYACIGGKRGGAKVKRYFFLTNMYGPLRASTDRFLIGSLSTVAGGAESFPEII